MTDEKNAKELVADLRDADTDEVNRVLAAERERKDGGRATVIQAGEDRLAELDIPGDVQDSQPTGPWAQLLDGDTGEPVYVDGKVVATDITPESVPADAGQ